MIQRKYYDMSGYAVRGGPRATVVRGPPPVRSVADTVSWYARHPEAVSPAVLLGVYPSGLPGPQELERPERPRRHGLARLLLAADRVLSWPYRKASVGWEKAELLKRKGDEAWGKSKVKGELYYLGAAAIAAVTGAASAITGLVAPAAYVDMFGMLAHPRRTLGELKSEPLTWAALAGGFVAGKVAGRVVAAGRARVYEPDLSALERADVFVGGRVEGVNGVLRHDWVARIEVEGVARPAGRGAPLRRFFRFSRGPGEFWVEERGAGRVNRVFRYFRGGKKIVGLEEWQVKGERFRFRGFYKDPVVAKALLENPADVLRRVVRPRPVYVYSGVLEVLGAALGAGLGLASSRMVREEPSRLIRQTSLTGTAQQGKVLPNAYGSLSSRSRRSKGMLIVMRNKRRKESRGRERYYEIVYPAPRPPL